MTITCEPGSVRIGYDLLDDAGPEEIQAALDALLGVCRSARYRALVALMQQFTPSPVSGPSFDVAPAPSPEAETSVEVPATDGEGDVIEFVALDKVTRTDTGVIELRAVPASGKWTQYGVRLPDAMLGDYLRRAGLAGDVGMGRHAHKSLNIRVGVTDKGYPRLLAFV